MAAGEITRTTTPGKPSFGRDSTAGPFFSGAGRVCRVMFDSNEPREAGRSAGGGVEVLAGRIE